MRIFTKRILPFYFFFLFLGSNFSFASHIVGGDITVKWVSANDFEVTLTFIRDCAGISMPGTVTIGVYDKVTDALQQSILITQTSNDILTLGDACYAPTFCRQRGIYKKTVSIPNNANGYYLMYGECCRNAAITNIVSPSGEGFVYYCEIADPALHNSTPTFSAIPDGYMCLGYLNSDNFSATDANGDVLVYSFVTPLSGSGLAPKPYGTITWQSGYATNNPMGDPSMVINSANGMINTTPPAYGIYVFSVLVEEYRSGVKIGEIRRDFQYEILNCKILSIASTPGNIVCTGTSTTITANGVSAGFTYAWAPGGQTTSSIVVNPTTAATYTYSVTTVNGTCSSFQSFSLTVNPTPTAVITTSGNPCAGISNTLTASGGSTYAWNTGAAGAVLTGVPVANYTVWVTNAFNCTSTATASISPIVTSDYTWTGAGSTGANNWFDSNNWSNGQGCLPSCLTNVIIPNSPALVITNSPDIGTTSGPASCKNITIATGNTLTFSSPASELQICGDFIDNGIVQTTGGSKGVIKFTGNIPQNFIRSNTSSGNPFYQVVLANTATPLATVTIKEGSGYKDMPIGSSGSFTFQSGVLVTEGDRKLYIQNTSGTCLSGYGVTSYVNGILKRNVVNNTTYYFPVGQAPVAGNSYPYELMKIDFTSVSGGLTDLTVYFENPPNATGTGLPVAETSGSGQYTTILDNGGINTGIGYAGGYGGMWAVMPNTGSATYDLTLYGRNYSNAGAYQHSILSRDEFCPGSWGMKGSYTSSSVVGSLVTVYRTALSGFSHKGIAKVVVPLPIELFAFDASCDHHKTKISWVTASETSNDHFTLERSCDENYSTYESIAVVPGAGNSSTMRSYSIIDKDETGGECFYRLSQTDFDGTTKYFSPISINCQENADFNFIGVLPNPAEDEVNVLFTSLQEENVSMKLTDMTGKELESRNVLPDLGLNRVQLSVGRYPAGIYFVTLNNGNRVFIKKLIKKK